MKTPLTGRDFTDIGELAYGLADTKQAIQHHLRHNDIGIYTNKLIEEESVFESIFANTTYLRERDIP